MVDHVRPGVNPEPRCARLVPLDARHARALAALADDDPDFPSAAPGRHAPLQSVLSFIARARRLRARGAGETVAVCDGERIVGIARLIRDPAAPDRAELGYWIARPHRGRGYATAAARQLVGHGFGHMALAAIVARCPGANRASALVLERVGFRFVGLEPSPDPAAGDGPVRRYELARREGRRGERTTSAASPPPP